MRTHVDVGQLDALAGEEELTDLVGMGHAAGLAHVEHPIVLAVALECLEEEPAVDERRNPLLGQGRLFTGVQAREQGSHALGFQVVHLTSQHRRHFGVGCYPDEVGDWVLDDDCGLELGDELLHGEEVSLETEKARPEALELQQACIHPLA